MSRLLPPTSSGLSGTEQQPQEHQDVGKFLGVGPMAASGIEIRAEGIFDFVTLSRRGGVYSLTGPYRDITWR